MHRILNQTYLARHTCAKKLTEEDVFKTQFSSSKTFLSVFTRHVTYVLVRLEDLVGVLLHVCDFSGAIFRHVTKVAGHFEQARLLAQILQALDGEGNDVGRIEGGQRVDHDHVRVAGKRGLGGLETNVGAIRSGVLLPCYFLFLALFRRFA